MHMGEQGVVQDWMLTVRKLDYIITLKKLVLY